LKATSRYYSSKSVLIYNGKEKELSSWEKKWLAKAKGKGYKEVILSTVLIAKHSDIMKKADSEEEKLRIHELNQFAYSNSMLSMDIKKAGGSLPSTL
jgi:hypothetical protein